jgi:hypothetical protein
MHIAANIDEYMQIYIHLNIHVSPKTCLSERIRIHICICVYLYIFMYT